MRLKYPADISRSYAAIETLAATTRRELGLSPVARLNGLKVFESLKRSFVYVEKRRIPLDYAIVELPPGIEAEARFEPERASIVVCLSPLTYTELERGQPRALFTVLHEIAHAMLHAAEIVRLSAIPRLQQAALQRGVYSKLRPFEDAEWQADAFAGAMAAPAKALEELRLQRQLTVEVCMETFGISRQCAEIRLRVFEKKRPELLRASRQ